MTTPRRKIRYQHRGKNRAVPKILLWLRLTGLVLILFFVYGLLAWQVSLAERLAIIGVIIGILAVPGFVPQPAGKRSLDEIATQLREEIRLVWRPEAQARGLLDATLMSLRLITSDEHGASLRLKAPERSWWTSEVYQRAVGRMALDRGLCRAEVFGSPGSGKSTLALLLTLGVLLEDSRKEILPLLLSMASWNPEEKFSSWFDRQINLVYSKTRSLEPGKDGTLLGRLVNSEGVLLILDGLDEIDEKFRRSAIKQINSVIPSDAPLILFSTKGRSQSSESRRTRPRLRNSQQVVIADPTPMEVAAYLKELAKPNPSIWEPVTSVLEASPDGTLAKALSSPLYVALAWQVCSSGALEPQELAEEARRQTSQNLQDILLLDKSINEALVPPGVLGRKRARYWLEFMAYEMSRRNMTTLAWWRTYRAVPYSARIGVLGTVAAPAYWLALLMPLGLTRGFAIGTMTGVMIGLTRGDLIIASEYWTQGRPTQAAGIIALVSAVVVSIIGTMAIDWQDGVLDGVEFGVALGLVVWLKRELVGARWISLLTVAFIGLASGITTAGVGAALPSAQLNRTVLSLTLAVTLGVGVAVMSARLLTSVTSLQPSNIDIRRVRGRGWPFPHLVPAMICGTAVGMAGGLVGTIRYGVMYGVGVAFVFGLVVGLPAGLVAGLIRWLNQPLGIPTPPTGRSTLETDRLVTIGCVFAVGLASSLSITVLLGPFHSVVDLLQQRSPFRVRPIHGALFGLTIGVIVASFNTAWPTYVVSHLWFVLQRQLPLRFAAFLVKLADRRVLQRHGPLYEFRHVSLQRRLADDRRRNYVEQEDEANGEQGHPPNALR